jgi:hypothetical protein
MRTLISLFIASILALSVTACKTDEAALRDSSSTLLGAREVKELLLGNTVTATNGDTYYFDRGGVVIGKGSYGEKNKGNWNITTEGQLCFSNWNAAFAPSACYKVFFDNTSQQRKLVDANGDAKYTVVNIVTGNPNNF